MKRSKSMEALGGRRWRFSHAILTAVAVYFVFISLKFCHFPESGSVRSGDRRFSGGSGGATGDVGRHFLGSIYNGDAFHLSHDPSQVPHNDPLALQASPLQPYRQRYGRITGEMLRRFERSQNERENQNQNQNRKRTRSGNFSELEKMARESWLLGLKAWEEVKSYKAGAQLNSTTVLEGKPKSCPPFVFMNNVTWGAGGERIMFLPCGLAVGSSITVIGTPQIADEGRNGKVMVSQFVVELQGLKAVEGEDPPKILHLNPRLKGDFSKRPVIEHNTCYRMKWGKPMRCDGRPSEGSNETGK